MQLLRICDISGYLLFAMKVIEMCRYRTNWKFQIQESRKLFGKRVRLILEKCPEFEWMVEVELHNKH